MSSKLNCIGKIYYVFFPYCKDFLVVFETVSQLVKLCTEVQLELDTRSSLNMACF